MLRNYSIRQPPNNYQITFIVLTSRHVTEICSHPPYAVAHTQSYRHVQPKQFKPAIGRRHLRRPSMSRLIYLKAVGIFLKCHILLPNDKRTGAPKTASLRWHKSSQ
jgi:hypothetical protein